MVLLFIFHTYYARRSNVGQTHIIHTYPHTQTCTQLALSLICGNTNLWKPAESTSLVAIASAKARGLYYYIIICWVVCRVRGVCSPSVPPCVYIPTPLSTATPNPLQQIIQQVLLESGHDPAIATLVCGLGPEVGEKLVGDPRMELISFTGSTKAST